MKSYLSLIPVSAKIHKRQNTMTLLCIVFAVFLVTAIFSMAEIGIRMEASKLLSKHGSLSVADILGSTMGLLLLLIGVILFILIVVAGILMISSSINSNVAQRTKFFGMMRCIGMSKEQVIRFVKLEALNWCKTAIPIGLILGIVASWILSGALHFIVGEEFSQLPIFTISMAGILSGILVGLLTVLLAARSPAKKAASVSPIVAVSGNWGNAHKTTYVVNTNKLKIETALGINHGLGAKKNLLLISMSFALTTILFLSFSALIDFVGYIMPQYSNTADLAIASQGGRLVEKNLVLDLEAMKGVKEVYGRKTSLGIEGYVKKIGPTKTVDLISYDDFDLNSLRRDKLLKKGSDISKVYGNSGYVLASWDPESPLEIGDVIEVAGKELEIAGRTTLVTSDETFTRLTGIKDYSLIMLQTKRDITEEELGLVRKKVGEDYTFIDKRDQRTSGTYMAFVMCIYGFLGIIALVAILNIVNNISMSVTARVREYGAMMAVGMSQTQIRKMITVEAFTYAISGSLLGSIIGILVNKSIYKTLISNHFSFGLWKFPLLSLLIIVIFTLTSTAIAIYGPVKRMKETPIIEILNEL